MTTAAGASARPARRRRLVAAVACLVVGLAALGLRLRAAPARDAPPAAHPSHGVPVVATPARRGDVAVTEEGIGTVTPLATVTVRTRVDGELVRVAFEEGQVVHAGDLLAEIDPRPFQVQLAQAEGQMARDQALLANARLDRQRYAVLVQQRAVPKQQLDTQEALVRQYEGAVVADQGQIDAARLQLTYARITAPITGRLGLRLVDPGNVVHASDAGGLVVITQLEPIGVVFTIPEDALPPVLERLRADATLPVTAYDRAGTRQLATGTLLTVDNAIDPSTGTVRLKARFPNTDAALFPNQFVNARLELTRLQGVTLVPQAAVRRGTGGPFVWVVSSERTVAARPVRLGVRDGDDAVLDDGVTPGELVVVDGAEGLRAGGAVTLRGGDAGG